MNSRQLLACTLAFALAGPVAGASLTLLPEWFDAPTVRANWMMPDGASFIGVDDINVYRWTAATGRTNLGTIPKSIGSEAIHPSAISDDGSTIIGYLGDDQFQPNGGFVWTAPNGVVEISTSADGTIIRAAPSALSSDGRIIVGTAILPTYSFFDPPEKVGFRWTPDTGTIPLGFDGLPSDVSADGNAIVGRLPTGVHTSEAFRWTAQDGAEALGFLPSDWQTSGAQFVSDDGSVVVGSSYGASGYKTFRWTEQTGMQLLSSQGDEDEARGISADANVIVGAMSIINHDVPGWAKSGYTTIWTPQARLQTLSELLATLELDHLEPISDPNKVSILTDVSADGHILFGTSSAIEYRDNPYIPIFHYERWLLDVSPAPEPTTLCLALLSLAPFLSGRRTRSISSRWPRHVARSSAVGVEWPKIGSKQKAATSPPPRD